MWRSFRSRSIYLSAVYSETVAAHPRITGGPSGLHAIREDVIDARGNDAQSPPWRAVFVHRSHDHRSVGSRQHADAARFYAGGVRNLPLRVARVAVEPTDVEYSRTAERPTWQ